MYAEAEQHGMGAHCACAEGRHDIFKGLFILADEGAELAVVVEEHLVLRRHGRVHALQFLIVDLFRAISW